MLPTLCKFSSVLAKQDIHDKTIQESQELQEISNKEQAFIAYGAVNINYALREINKKAKSKGLEKLLGKLDESFFNKQSSK